jgi:hypothetical protein
MINAVLWILAASLTGFSIAAVFAGWLRLNRNTYLFFYIPAVALLFSFFIIANKINVVELMQHNFLWGLAGTVIVSLLLIRNVLSQPPSERSRGFEFMVDMVWPGFAYGVCDALLLSILPVLAIKFAFSGLPVEDSFSARTGFILSGLAASFLVTTAYHLGYPEFRGKKVIFANIGNGILTLAFLLTMNPLAAIIPHSIMHIAAMIHGKETTGQVPPHYN